jgi:hypothetical protein
VIGRISNGAPGWARVRGGQCGSDSGGSDSGGSDRGGSDSAGRTPAPAYAAPVTRHTWGGPTG